MAATIDEQFIAYIVKSLVSVPDAVSIARSEDDKGILLELTVDAADLGRVIGKHGATAQSLRTLLRALGTKNDERYNLKIVDVDKPEHERNRAAVPRDDAVADDVEAVGEDDAVAPESDKLKQTRAELADLDDLDI